jgi:hypothetical protein
MTEITRVNVAVRILGYTVQGSETNWYKNILHDSDVKISVDGQQYNGKSKAIIDSNKVKEVMNKFISKYGESEVNKYYTKFDVCV